jgi:hypothetical protein
MTTTDSFAREFVETATESIPSGASPLIDFYQPRFRETLRELGIMNEFGAKIDATSLTPRVV